MDGARATIISNARELSVVEPLTDDPSRLLAALERLEHDREQWDMWAELEDRRVRDIVQSLNEGGNLDGAMSLARLYQREEYWRTDRNLRRVELALGRLVDESAPKALLYFADALRDNPGEHYLAFFGQRLRNSEALLSVASADGLQGGLAIDRLVNEAAAQGIRIYPVEARGLTVEVDAGLVNPAGLNTTGTVASSSRVRVGDTHRTLQGMAAETGGVAFLNGVRAERIAAHIVADGACLYLASFDPGDLAEDVPLRVIVESARPDVKLRVRGRLVLLSESSRRTAEILRAFAAPNAPAAEPFDLRAGLVPTGYSGGRYSALLQIAVPALPLQGAVWDVGATLVRGSNVSDRASGRISTPEPGIPVVLEREVRFRPGLLEVVAVAHEERSGLVASERFELAWPELDPERAAVGPVALLQPAPAAFLREAELRRSGSLVVDSGTPLDPSRPAAFVALVCAGKRRSGPLNLERRLVGPTVHEFPVIEVTPDPQGCAQVRDVVPSNTLKSAAYRFEIVLRDGDGTLLGAGEREFVVEGPLP